MVDDKKKGRRSGLQRLATERGLPDRVSTILAAFGPPDGPGMAAAVDLESVEEEARVDADAVLAALDGEVDHDQAAMFARRAAQVFALLGRLAEAGSDEARVYRVGLARRLLEVCAAPGPRALRVRALADFYGSQAALLRHRARLAGTAVQKLEALVAAASWREVAPGVSHAHIASDCDLGPIHCNLLRVSGGQLRAVDARTETEAGRSLAELAAASGAIAAVSGGYFLYSEPDITPPSRRTDPVGLLVTDGRVVNPPAFRRATLSQDGAGRVVIDVVDLVGATLRWPGGAVEIVAHNDGDAVDQGAVSFNRAFGFGVEAEERPCFAVVGGTVVAGAPQIPLAGVVIVAPPGTPRPEVGTSVTCELAAPVDQAMAGGPMLFDAAGPRRDLFAEDFDATAPPVTFSQDETFDQNLLPRMGAGVTAEGAVVFAAVDGRNFDLAPGMRLRDLARLMRAAGCVRAMNLDGGSSKRMVIAGEVVDLPSTEVVSRPSEDAERVRPVHTAILVYAG